MGYLSTSVWCIVGLSVIFSVTSGQAVTWVERPQSVSAREGQNVTFKCRLSNNAPVVWAADKDDGLGKDLFVYGEKWTQNTRYSLTDENSLVIQDIRKTDNRVYACKTRDAGIQTATLTVLLFPGPPVVTPDTTNQVYSEGQQVRFTCSSTGGNPSPRIVWMKNGNISNAPTEDKPAAEVGGTASSSITIKMDKSDHQANYSCLLYNDLNVDNKLIKSIVLSVQYSPSIGFRPYSSYTVKRGDQIQFFCDVDANPPVSSVTWTKDSAPIPGTSPSRSITSVSVSDQGTYTCSAENSIGKSSGDLALEVQYVPILTVPATKTVDEGDDVSILCEIEANPRPYETQWSKVGSPGQSQNSDTLTIPSVTRDAAGNYSCKAMSQLRLSGESVKFVSAEMFTYLYVKYIPGKASISGSDEVDVGERLAITCTTTPAGYPEASYTWTKNGETLSETSATYVIASSSLGDNGRYSCTPRNDKGQGEAASVDVKVYEPPTIIEEPSLEMHVRLSESNPVVLRCVTQGYPQPRVTWYQDGYSRDLGEMPGLFTIEEKTKTEGAQRVRVESILEFKGALRDVVTSSSKRTHLKIRDMGNYTCKAETDKHTDTPTASTELLINFSPVLEQTATRYAVSRLDSLTLQCQAQAHPPPAFQWFYQGQRLSSDPGEVKVTHTTPITSSGGVSNIKSSLTIEEIHDENYGVYRCTAINALGNTSVDIEVTGKSRPEQPHNLRVTSTTWESVHLSWEAGFDGGYPQRFFINKTRKVVPLSARSFNVTQLLPSTSYTFRVFAANQLGMGIPSEPVIIKTNDLVIPTLPEIPVFNAKERKLLVTSPEGNFYCLRVSVKVNGNWRPYNGCMKVVGDTLELNETGIRALNVSVCLSHRPDVCGLPMTADIYSSDKEPTLTEDHVIIIACVCAVIIITLLIILVCFCVRRKRYIAKGSQGQNQGDPPPYQAVPPNKKPVSHHQNHNHHHHQQQQQQQHHGGYDNQDGPLELYADKGKYNPWGNQRASQQPSTASPSTSTTAVESSSTPTTMRTLADVHFQFTSGKTTPDDDDYDYSHISNSHSLSPHLSPSSDGVIRRKRYDTANDKRNNSNGTKFRLDLNSSPFSPIRHGYYNTSNSPTSVLAGSRISSPSTPMTNRTSQSSLYSASASPAPSHRHSTGSGYENLKTHSNRMEGYPHRDMSPQGIAISGGPHPPHSPNKDKYIDLQDRGGGGGDMVDGKGGYPDDQTAAGGKPKKVIYEVVV